MKKKPGELLGAYILRHYKTNANFCRATGLETSYVSLLVRGKRGKRMSSLMAASIERATKGAIKACVWTS